MSEAIERLRAGPAPATASTSRAPAATHQLAPPPWGSSGALSAHADGGGGSQRGAAADEEECSICLVDAVTVWFHPCGA